MSTISTSYRRALAALIGAGALAAATICLIAPAPPATAMPDHSMSGGKGTVSAKALALHDAMRALWEAHGTWTERAIVDYVGELPDAELAIERLLQNQKEIGDAIKPYYGAKAGAELTRLLKAHINDAVAVLVAAKAGDASATARAKASFYANGNEVARFLHSANPRHWSLKAMRTMMRIHLDQVVGLAVDQLTGRYDAAIRLYGAYIEHLHEMADMLSEGVVEQFPERFH